MIEVNLLPGGKKGAKGPGFSFKLPTIGAVPKDPWILGAAAVVIVVGGLSSFLYSGTSSSQQELTVGIEAAVADSARYFDLIQQNDALAVRRNALAERVGVIQEIDGDRYIWPHIMDEVARALPEYTWLTELMQVTEEPLMIRLAGQAGNNFAVTQFMENLEATLFLRGVRLISTEQVVVDGRIVSQFELEVLFERPPPELLQTVPLFDAGPSGP